jgi:hypothetical protein
MPKRSSKKPADEQAVEQVPTGAQEQTAGPAPDGKNPAAVMLGRLGGKKGGPARAAKLTKEQRAEIARKAAQARWAKKTEQAQS